MQTQQPAAFTATPILTLKDLGFEGTVGLDQASRGLAERSEAQIVRWVQFPAGALFFVLVLVTSLASVFSRQVDFPRGHRR